LESQSHGEQGEERQGVAARFAPRTNLEGVVANVGDRVQEILDTAERVAVQIRAEAEAAATEYLEQRRAEADRAAEDRLRQLKALTQSLAARAASVERETSALVTELDTAVRRLGELAEPSPAWAEEAEASAPQAAASGTRAQPQAPEREPVGDRLPEQALLRATQMAVSGTERTEIEMMLRTEFGIRDPESVIAQMLGSERA
jgi:hypothetical protein